MARRRIYVAGAERWITLGQYVAAVRRAKANPAATFKCGLSCWWPCTGAEIVQQFVAGLQDRINQAIPYVQRGAEKRREQNE